MKADTSVDKFVQTKILPPYREVAQAIRKLMRDIVPDATEAMSYGVPTYRLTLIIAVISPTKKGITLAFSNGVAMEDKYHLLEGVGKKSKNVRMKSMDEFNREALTYYIKQAVILDNK